MSDKFDAMMLILNRLNRQEEVTVQSLMDELGVGDRTVYRYIETLRKADYPIEYDQQRKRYTFAPGYALGKIGLSNEEDLVFNLGREMLRGLGGRTGKIMDGLAAKIGEKKCLPRHILVSVRGQAPEVERYLNELNSAITDFLRVRIQYKTAHRENEECSRVIEPGYLFFDNGSWYVRGYCRLRKEMRLFNLRQIASLEVLHNDPFMPKQNYQDGAAANEVAHAFGGVVDGDPVEVTLRFDKSSSPYVTRQQWHPSQKTKTLSDGRLEFSMIVPSLLPVKRWVYQFLPNVEVVKPKELKDEVVKELQVAVKKNK